MAIGQKSLSKTSWGKTQFPIKIKMEDKTKWKKK